MSAQVLSAYLRFMEKIPAWKFLIYKWLRLPAAGFMGVGLGQIDEDTCETVLRLGWRNTNPFRSLYFAAQCSAAEMATGLAAYQIVTSRGSKVSMLVTGMDALFHKKATGKVVFRCSPLQAIRDAVELAHAQADSVALQVPVKAVQTDTGVLVSEFVFHWSFKKRS